MRRLAWRSGPTLRRRSPSASWHSSSRAGVDAKTGAGCRITNASRRLLTSPPHSAMRTDELQRGIELFNSGEFLQCHDYLEELIPFESGQGAEFFHGLMELAAACYHLKQGNIFGARYLLTSAIDLLAPYHPFYQGIDVERLLAQVEHCRILTSDLEDDEDVGFDESHLPHID